jgi:subtilisin family serine protease
VDASFVGLLVVQIWHQHEDELQVRLRSPNGEFFEPPAEGEDEADRGKFIVQSSHQRAHYSGDNVTTFLIITVPQHEWLRGWSLKVRERRDGNRHGVQVGAVHAWILDSDMGEFTQGVARTHLVGIPGTAYSAITVGSYATRRDWPSGDPDFPDVVLRAVNLEDISYFSSPGPTRDGHNKPEIAAPGQWLISALSEHATEEYVPPWTRLPDVPYAAMQGTSMAAPYVTGAIALLLERAPGIDWAEAKRRLIKSARQDGFTHPCWNARWGYGKINVQRLLTIEPQWGT